MRSSYTQQGYKLQQLTEELLKGLIATAFGLCYTLHSQRDPGRDPTLPCQPPWTPQQQRGTSGA